MSQNETVPKLVPDNKTSALIAIFLIAFIVAFTTSIPNSVKAQTAQQAETVEDAQQQLEDLKSNVGGLKYFAERIDIGRIMVLERRIEATAENVKTKGLGNWETMKSYQELVIAFRYSEKFMESISTELSSGYVTEIKKMIDALIKSRGFDKNVTGSLVANILKQIKNLVDQIQSGRDLDPALEGWIRTEFNKAIVDAIAAANVRGDSNFNTLFKAREIYSMLESKYPQLYKINVKNSAYNMVTELMGLVEFYKAIESNGLTPEQESVINGVRPNSRQQQGME